MPPLVRRWRTRSGSQPGRRLVDGSTWPSGLGTRLSPSDRRRAGRSPEPQPDLDGRVRRGDQQPEVGTSTWQRAPLGARVGSATRLRGECVADRDARPLATGRSRRSHRETQARLDPPRHRRRPGAVARRSPGARWTVHGCTRCRRQTVDSPPKARTGVFRRSAPGSGPGRSEISLGPPDQLSIEAHGGRQLLHADSLVGAVQALARVGVEAQGQEAVDVLRDRLVVTSIGAPEHEVWRDDDAGEARGDGLLVGSDPSVGSTSRAIAYSVRVPTVVGRRAVPSARSRGRS